MVVARRGGGRGTKNFVGSRQSKASGTGRWQQRRTKGPGTPNWDMIQNPKGLILSDSLGVPISASLVSTQHTHTHTNTRASFPQIQRLVPTHGDPHPLVPTSALITHLSTTVRAGSCATPFYCHRQGQRRRAMSAISTCYSPPSLATGHKRQIPFYLYQHSPWAIFTSHCHGITKAERDSLTK